MTENMMQTTDTKNDVVTREETRESERYVTPVVDIYEEEGGLTVVADMPGLEKDDVEISAEKNVLKIVGRARQSMERDWTYQEFVPRSYYREFRLGNKIDQGGIQAEYKNGVLNLKLPFSEEEKPRKIDVKVG